MKLEPLLFLAAGIFVGAMLGTSSQPGTMPVQVVTQPRDLWVTLKVWKFDGMNMVFADVTIRASDIHIFPERGPDIDFSSNGHPTPSAQILTGQVYPFTYVVPGTQAHWEAVFREYFRDPTPATFTALE